MSYADQLKNLARRLSSKREIKLEAWSDKLSQFIIIWLMIVLFGCSPDISGEVTTFSAGVENATSSLETIIETHRESRRQSDLGKIARDLFAADSRLEASTECERAHDLATMFIAGDDVSLPSPEERIPIARARNEYLMRLLSNCRVRFAEHEARDINPEDFGIEYDIEDVSQHYYYFCDIDLDAPLLSATGEPVEFADFGEATTQLNLELENTTPEAYIGYSASDTFLTLAALTDLQRYTAALLKAAQGEDIAAIRTAGGELVQAFQNIAGRAGPYGPAASAAVNVIGTAVIEVSDFFLTRQRAQLLGEVVSTADPLVQDVSRLSCFAAYVLSIKPVSDGFQNLRTQIDRLRLDIDNRSVDEADVAERLVQIETSLLSFVRLAQADYTGVFMGLGDAHAQIVRAANDDDVDLSEVIATIRDFADRAERIRDAVKALEEALN